MWKKILIFVALGILLLLIVVAFGLILRAADDNSVIAAAAVIQATAAIAIAYYAYQTFEINRASLQVRGTLHMWGALEKEGDRTLAGHLTIVNSARIRQQVLAVNVHGGRFMAPHIALKGYKAPFDIEAGSMIVAEYTIELGSSELPDYMVELFEYRVRIHSAFDMTECTLHNINDPKGLYRFMNDP